MWYCLMLAVPLMVSVGWVFSGFCIRNEDDRDEEEDLLADCSKFVAVVRFVFVCLSEFGDWDWLVLSGWVVLFCGASFSTV